MFFKVFLSIYEIYLEAFYEGRELDPLIIILVVESVGEGIVAKEGTAKRKIQQNRRLGMPPQW